MSKYKTIECEFRNLQSLLKALEDLHYGASKVEVNQANKINGLPMYGYHGDLRPETVSVRIDRKGIGQSSNDVGFRWNGHSYEAIISEYDSSSSGPFNQDVTNKLKQKYAYHETRRIAFSKGYTVQEKAGQNGEISLVLMRR